VRLAHDLARGQTATWANLVNTAASTAEIEEQNPGWPHSGHTTAFNPTPSLQSAVAATTILQVGDNFLRDLFGSGDLFPVDAEAKSSYAGRLVWHDKPPALAVASMHGRGKAPNSIAQVSISRTLIDTRARLPFSLNSDGEGAALHFDIEAGYEAG
jgi:hypothetical protein